MSGFRSARPFREGVAGVNRFASYVVVTSTVPFRLAE